MAVRNGWPAVSLAPTFSDIRHAQVGRYVRTSSGAVRAGVLPVGGGVLVESTSTMGVNVGPFVAVLNRDGAIEIEHEGTSYVPLDPGPGANSRIDVIYVTQNIEELGDATDGPVLGVKKGTAAGVPQKPTLDDIPGALEVGSVTVPAGAVTTAPGSGVSFTPSGPLTAAAGGVVLFRSLPEMYAADVASETLGTVIGSAGLYRRSDATWLPYVGAHIARRSHQGSPTFASGDTSTKLRLPLGNGTTSDGEVFGLESNTIRVKRAGWYRVSIKAAWGNNGTGARAIEAYIDASTPVGLEVADTRNASGTTAQSASDVVYLGANVAVAIYAYQTSGATLGYKASIAIEWVSA